MVKTSVMGVTRCAFAGLKWELLQAAKEAAVQARRQLSALRSRAGLRRRRKAHSAVPRPSTNNLPREGITVTPSDVCELIVFCNAVPWGKVGAVVAALALSRGSPR
jgi:hypothetical protein